MAISFIIDIGQKMSNSNKPYHNKGAGLAFLIIAFTMIGVPVVIGTSMGWFNLFGILGL